MERDVEGFQGRNHLQQRRLRGPPGPGDLAEVLRERGALLSEPVPLREQLGKVGATWT
jgi:hypothetical protein